MAAEVAVAMAMETETAITSPMPRRPDARISIALRHQPRRRQQQQRHVPRAPTAEAHMPQAAPESSAAPTASAAAATADPLAKTTTASDSERVLLLAPTGRDADILSDQLVRRGFGVAA